MCYEFRHIIQQPFKFVILQLEIRNTKIVTDVQGLVSSKSLWTNPFDMSNTCQQHVLDVL